MDEFSKRLKELRLERDLSMDMLVTDLKAQYPDLKIEKSMLSRWESGTNTPTWENVKHLSMYFNVSLDYLAGLTDVRTPSRLLAYGSKMKQLYGDKKE